ncbi:hypothetical protein G1C96_0260 [Bifidobacterium sp. DSM 109958]|uniref:Uncharacterized protein n=1 Tax=Bifidobacterium moraviense TaxID=2675323 RepID=A0A7Y0F0C3_9BIFI|nr:hypothetical protein [Bifidobacterium sp. DSM 109958]NMM99682.1 hypothetical protein [Bifidobacterium sp. DSM 109958]
MTGDLLTAMSRDLGIPRLPHEDDGRFAGRVTYTALRFWMQAYCLDDGYGGACGMSSSAIVRKARLWLRNMSDLYPGMIGWYRQDDGIDECLRRTLPLLADAHDLEKNEDGLYRCTASRRFPIGHGTNLLLGLYDPSNPTPDSLPLSGLASAFSSIAGAKDRAAFGDDAQAQEDHVPHMSFETVQGSEYVVLHIGSPLRDLKCRMVIELLTWPMRAVDDQRQRLLRMQYMRVLSRSLRSPVAMMG